jgi:hypothetical protein
MISPLPVLGMRERLALGPKTWRLCMTIEEKIGHTPARARLLGSPRTEEHSKDYTYVVKHEEVYEQPTEE